MNGVFPAKRKWAHCMSDTYQTVSERQCNRIVGADFFSFAVSCGGRERLRGRFPILISLGVHFPFKLASRRLNNISSLFEAFIFVFHLDAVPVRAN